MKNIILGAVAATALLATNISVTKSVHAADSSHCNVLDHGPQFNKTELSAFDKCWINTHRADKKSGVSGNVFWVKVGDDFISMPTKKLYQSGSKQAAKEMIKERIIERVVEVESGTIIDSLRTQVEDLAQAEADGLRRIAELSAELITKNSRISQLTAEGFLKNSTITGLRRDVTRLNGEIAAIGQNLATANQLKADAEAALTAAQADLATARANNFGFAQRLAALTRNYNRAVGISNRIRTEVTAGTLATYAALNPTTLNSYNATVPSKTAPTGDATGNDGSNVFAANHEGSLGSKSGYAVLADGTRLVNPHTVQTTAEAITLLAETVYDHAFDKGYLEGFDEGYEQGYSDGYSDGYDAGYADGFADGVASTQ